MTAAVEFDGSGNIIRQPAPPVAQTKTGKYGVVDLSGAYPQKYGGAMSFGSELLAALSTLKTALFSQQSRLNATKKADVAVWFGPTGGWTWIEAVPYPGTVDLVQ